MPMTVSKTRDMLVDVARQLFARMGVDNITMNDIAQASGKGRRTLYTYFKNKNEIYLAVVESELSQLHRVLMDVSEKTLPADEKLITFIYTRLDAIKALVFRNGTLRATFFRDIWRVEKVRKDFDVLEVKLLKNISKNYMEINYTDLIMSFYYIACFVPFLLESYGRILNLTDFFAWFSMYYILEKKEDNK